MNRLNFDWDEKKNSSNFRKHGVTFDEAKTVFADELGRLIHDPDHSEEDDRFILVGMSSHLRLLKSPLLEVRIEMLYEANGRL